MICFFFNDTATTEIYTLSLHDALPISDGAEGHGLAPGHGAQRRAKPVLDRRLPGRGESVAAHGAQIGNDRSGGSGGRRSEEHTSELQSQSNIVCRLLLEKKKKTASSCIYNYRVNDIDSMGKLTNMVKRNA